jgi:hypothetical protein
LLDLPNLIEMLAQETSNYINLVREHGHTAQSDTCRDTIINLQIVIEEKRKAQDALKNPGFSKPVPGPDTHGAQKPE